MFKIYEIIIIALIYTAVFWIPLLTKLICNIKHWFKTKRNKKYEQKT